MFTRAATTALMVCAAGVSTLASQAVDDGALLPRRMLSTGVVYARDSWDQYWEGTLRRQNGNIGTLTTQSVTWVSGYGVTDRLSVMAVLPYVWTEASQGTLHGLRGVQDLTVGAKYRLLTEDTRHGAISAFVGAAASLPMSDYTPDFLPLSIGTGGGRASGRLTLAFQSSAWWFARASAAHTWCSNVTLDRAAYYTDGQLYMTNEVAMPNVVDYSLSAGVTRGRWRIPVTLVQQRTLGGGDIRRQDMPFVSDRMDFTRIDSAVMYALPKGLSVRVGAGHVLAGRNVGQSTTVSSGLSYAIQF